MYYPNCSGVSKSFLELHGLCPFTQIYRRPSNKVDKSFSHERTVFMECCKQRMMNNFTGHNPGYRVMRSMA